MMLSASISVQTRSPPVRRPVSLKACVRAAPARCVAPPQVGFQRVAPKTVPAPRLTVVKAAAAADEPELDGIESVLAKVVGPKMAQTAVTGVFIFLWYALNVAFNLTNKTLFKSFPFPWTVSAVHVLVGTIYCAVTYFIGFKQASFGRPITKEELKQIFGPASMHALGHIAANVSFAAVAISLTHTVKTLEPAFNVVLSQLILGQSTPVPVLLSLVPVMVGVALASAAELSFNWVGFLSAMLSNLTFGFRAVLSKKAMAGSTITGTSLYAYTTLISLAICGPLALIFEGSKLQAGAAVAIEKLGAATFWQMLLAVGLLYHLYNQFAFNTLARVSPVSHGVCNVVKRVVIIGTSVVFFGNVLTTQTKIGTLIALLGTYLYTEATKAAKAKAAAAAAAEGKEE